MPGAINFCMSDIYGGYGMDTTTATVPDADDQNALTDTSTATTKPLIKSVKDTSKTKFYLSLILILRIVIVIWGKF